MKLSWNVILEESKLVACALGINEQFQKKTTTDSQGILLYDEKRDNEWEVQNNEVLLTNVQNKRL